MKILGIETSCDETSAAVVQDGRKILSNVIYSQHQEHFRFKGIVPEIASRAHVEKINFIIQQALFESKIDIFSRKIQEELDGIAVTVGPGLVGSLLVGKIASDALGWLWNIPVLGVNHLEAHLLSPLLSHSKIKSPFMGLIVSGGHTDLIYVEKIGKYKVLGRTRDDAAGECFDKAANLLGLGYPGGPLVDQYAQKGNSQAIAFARPMLAGSWDFSFSGLKTAVLYYLQNLQKENNSNIHKMHRDKKKYFSSQLDLEKINKKVVSDVCASLQAAIVEVLIEKTIKAAHEYKVKQILVGGGVSANSELRKQFAVRSKSERLKVYFPSRLLSTDNAAMIAAVGYHRFKSFKNNKNIFLPLNCSISIDPLHPSLPLENWA